MSILINLANLSLSFGEKIIFRHAELTINKGDRIGLIGLNGQGKSTLFKIIQKQMTPDISVPAFIYDKSTEPFEIFHVPQELNLTDFKDLTIENYFLAFYPKLLEVHRGLQTDPSNEALIHEFEILKGWDIQNAYVNYLNAFELFEHQRSIESLSGGEQRKMALSIGLSANAELILWDEPTNHLDIETIERFEDELQNLRKTYMIISHDRYLLNHTTDRICHIENGEINQFKGTYLDYLTYLEDREAEIAKNLDKLENRHRRELAWMRQGIKARGTRSKKRVEGYHNIRDQIKNIKSRSRKVVDLELTHSGRKTKKLVEITNGKFSYANKEIFTSLDLLVAKKDKIALIGPNGAGKSTLINIFQEKLELTDGKQKNAEGLKIVVFDQKRESLDEDQTPMQFLGEGNDYVILGNGQKKHINSYMSSFLFTSDQVHRPISTLSGGEKNRLQLAKFMKQSADLWVFDEPTNDLDIETIELLESELKSYDAAVIIIGHDRAFLDNICKTTWLINNKKLEIFEGGYTQVAPYLHALEMEKQLNDEEPDSVINEKTVETEKKKLTYNEKKRFAVIEDEISNAELLLEEASEALASFDFGEMDPHKQDQYEKLNKTKNEREMKLEALYEEWEDLSGKI